MTKENKFLIQQVREVLYERIRVSLDLLKSLEDEDYSEYQAQEDFHALDANPDGLRDALWSLVTIDN